MGCQHTHTADHAIELTKEGHEQARAAGEFLSGFFSKEAGRFYPKIRLWHSPYKRTRQTAEGIESTCLAQPCDGTTDEVRKIVTEGVIGDRKPGECLFWDKREHMLLAEQQFGVFDGLSDAEREEFYPREQAYYEKCKKFEGKLWPKMPLGESRFEVCQRVHQAFGTFHRDAERHSIRDIVVVGHGTTNRAFVQMWLHKPWEWMHQEPNPKNCSVRLIQDGQDMGYIFEGFKNPPTYKHAPNEAKEAGE